MIYSLAPMDWITNSSYRQIVKKIWNNYKNKSNDKLILYTEFVSSDWIKHNFDWIKSSLDFSENEKPLICQIFWSNLDNLLYSAKKIEKLYNFDWIDLNIWCPSSKIIKNWAWAALMINKKNTLNIVKTLSKQLSIPFSIKTRTWINDDDKQEQLKFIIEASNFCNIIAIHARTLKQWHSWNVDIDFVLNAKKYSNPKCKIFLNWWIDENKLWDKKFLDKIKNLDWIMIWKAAIWNPRIFVWKKPSLEEKKNIILEHLMLNIENIWEKKWVLEFRKFIWFYIKWIDNASKYRTNFMRIETYKEFKNLIKKI